ncbi:MAG: type II toxin-antitoxin system HipA family toxin [Alphaproteobacteria bacterium]
MANLLWGKVYYKDQFAGYLRQEPGDSASFAYDASYIEKGWPQLSHTLPVRQEAYSNNSGLHPFFDNLVSEGWLEQAQARLLGRREASRFELLLAFGFDCAGAVSIVDPDPHKLSSHMLDPEDPKEMAVMKGRASLSGVQPKLAAVFDDKSFRPARYGELSTHIAKFPSPGHPGLIENEYLTTLAVATLLPDDAISHLAVGEIAGVDETALIIKRFDRSNGERIHFEEFNQLLNRRSRAKYDGAYKDMASFINETKGCIPAQAYVLYKRILAGILLGNTDMHLKNFAMFESEAGYILTPSYDQVAANLYNYKTLALSISGASDLPLGGLKASNIVQLGEEFNLRPPAIMMAIEQLSGQISEAKDKISDAEIGTKSIKNQLINNLEKRWNGTFISIGQYLSQKP